MDDANQTMLLPRHSSANQDGSACFQRDSVAQGTRIGSFPRARRQNELSGRAEQVELQRRKIRTALPLVARSGALPSYRYIAMVQYVEGHCPNCGRPIRIRTNYFGKKLVCKSCDFRFRPAPPEGLLVDLPTLPDMQADLDLDSGPEGTAPGVPPRTGPIPFRDQDFQAVLEQYDPLEAELRIKPFPGADALAARLRVSAREWETQSHTDLSTADQRLAGEVEIPREEHRQHDSRAELLQPASAAQERDGFCRQADELGRQLNVAPGDADQHRRQNEELRRRFEAAISQLDQAQSEIQQRDQRETALTNQLASVRKDVERERNRADQLACALASAGAELAELRGREPEFQARLQAVQQMLSAVQAEVAGQRADLDGAVADVRARELAARQELAEQLMAARSQVEVLSRERERLAKECERLAAVYDRARDDL
jgi:hypothetical protein